jgi:hypothetical protein
MIDPATVVIYVMLALTVVVVLAAVFGRKRTRRAAYAVLVLFRGRPTSRR